MALSEQVLNLMLNKKLKKIINVFLRVINVREIGLDRFVFNKFSKKRKFKKNNEYFWHAIIDNYYESLRLDDVQCLARKSILSIFDILMALV